MNDEINLNDFVPKVHYELIPIRNLVSNQDYQRNLSVKHVEKAAANFDLCQINPVRSAGATVSTMYLMASILLKLSH